MTLLVPLNSRDEVVEDVKVAFTSGRCMTDARALEIVFNRLETVEPASIAELKLGVVAETRSIVVGNGMRIPKGFEDELESACPQ